MNISVVVIIPAISAIQYAAILFPPPNHVVIDIGWIDGDREPRNTSRSVIALVGVVGSDWQFITYAFFQSNRTLIDANIAGKNPVGDVQSIAAGLVFVSPDPDIVGLAGGEVLHNAEVDFASKIIVERDQTGAAAIQIANGIQLPGGADEIQPLIGFFTVFL